MDSIDRITLRWKRTTYTDLLSHNDYYFYAISRESNLLYIGNKQDQHVCKRIKQYISKKIDGEMRGLTFWLADVESHTFTVTSKSKSHVIHDVESLLIFRNQPVLNHHSTVKYVGTMNLRVLSHDCPRLKYRIESPK